MSLRAKHSGNGLALPNSLPKIRKLKPSDAPQSQLRNMQLKYPKTKEHSLMKS